MGKHKRVIRMIENKLGEGILMNTAQLKEYINLNTKNGIGSNALGNILAKNKQFVKKGEERVKGVSSNSYLVTIWGLS